VWHHFHNIIKTTIGSISSTYYGHKLLVSGLLAVHLGPGLYIIQRPLD
jgi:hypothetical protein